MPQNKAIDAIKKSINYLLFIYTNKIKNIYINK
jgi:hypothetical protein